MNIIDLVLFAIILLAVYAGYMKGFVRGMVDLLLLVLALAFAFVVYRPVADFFENHIAGIGVWTRPLAFILAYIFARTLLGAVALRVIREFGSETVDNPVDHTFGIFPGAVNGIINAAIISALLLAFPLFDGLSSKMRESSLANALTPAMEWAEEKLAPVFDDAIEHSINKLTIKPGSEETVKLPFTVNDARVREDLERRMLEFVNEERAEAGLRPLEADPEMRSVARAHSQDMFARGYFSHYTPEGKSISDRARKAGVRFLTAGENLALAQTLRIAHNGLMNSPGHRANILNAAYGRVGIGVLDGGRHGLMITQNFRN